MNTRTTFVVLLVAIVIGLYFLVFETGWLGDRLPTTRELEQRAQEHPAGRGTALFDRQELAADRVYRIRIERPDEPPVVLARDAERTQEWLQVEPFRFALRSWRVSDLVDRASGLRYTSTLRPGREGLALAEMGLEPPLAVVQLEGEAMEPVQLSLGRRAGAGLAYLAVGEPGLQSTIYVVREDLHEQVLALPWEDLRSRTLASFPTGRVERLRIERNGQVLQLRQEDGAWSFEEPVRGRADRQAAEELVQALTGASVESFVTDHPRDMEPYGLVEPQLTLEVMLTDAPEAEPAPTEAPRSHRLAIGATRDLEGETFYALFDDQPVVFTVRSRTVERLRRDVPELRDPRVTPVARTDVEAIRVEPAEAPPLHLVRSDGGWAFGDPDPGFALEQEVAERLLEAVFDARAADYLEPDEAGDRLVEVVMTLVGRSEPERLHVHRKDEQRLAVIRGDEPVAHVLDRTELQRLFESPLAFRERTVLDLEEERLEQVRLVRETPYPAEHVLRRQRSGDGEADNGDGNDSEGQWDLQDLDESAVRELLGHLTPLRAERWIPDEEGAEAPEGVVLHITLADATDHVLYLDPKRRVGRLEGTGTLFEVSEEAATAMVGELRQRLVLELDIDDIAQVEVAGHVVSRDEEGRYEVREGELDEAAAGALFDRLSALEAVYFVDASLAEGEPTAELTVRTRQDHSYRVRVWQRGDRNPIARLDGETFTLSEEAAAALTQPPARADEQSNGG